MILITGASGTVGGAVLAEVARTGQRHRALYRSKEEAAKATTGTEALIADFSDKASLAQALRGIDSVYLVCSPIPELVQLEGNVIEAIEAAGGRRIVLSSALGGRLPQILSELAPEGGRQAESDEVGVLHRSPEQLHTECADLLCAEHSCARSVLRCDGDGANVLRGCK
jgi:uncharacterized protein YbjT (DUF2867 family)